jgi:hypothetical protein
MKNIGGCKKGIREIWGGKQVGNYSQNVRKKYRSVSRTNKKKIRK